MPPSARKSAQKSITPKTDKEEFWMLPPTGQIKYVVLSSFARALEKELNEYRADYRALATSHSRQIADAAQEISRLKLKLKYHGSAH